MKKIFVILSVAFALAACDLEIPNQQEVITKNEFNITITRADDTKAVKTGWEEGDVVFVFFSTVAAPDYVKFTYSSGTWSNTKVGTFDITSNGNMTAIYLPYGNSETVSADGTSFKFSNTYTSYYLKAEKAPYTVSGGVVSGTLDMVAPEGFVQFAMPLSNGSIQFFRETAGAYTLKENHLTPCAFASVAADGTISNVAGYSAGDPISGYFYGEGDARTINFSGILSSIGSATEYSFEFVNNMGTGGTYDDVTYILSGNKTIAAKSAIKFPLISSSSWKVTEPGYVTVGGVKWAKFNVGATTVEGYGDYYAWGANYPQYKYEISDYQEGAIVADLTTSQDVAYQKLGSDWRMPTKSELEILKAKIPGSTWTTENGVYGYKIAPDSGYESEGYLFLPATGYWFNALIGDGNYGSFLSSTYYNTDGAWYLAFNYALSHVEVYNDCRSAGSSVRPVKGAPAPTYPIALSAVTSSYVGSVITSDGYVYATVSDASAATETAVAIIAYVGSAGSVDASSGSYKGLAIALSDANSGSKCNWAESNGTCVSQTNIFSTALGFKNGITCTSTLTGDGHTHAAATAAASNNGTAAPTGASGWFMPSMGQWNLIVQGLASKKAGSAITTDLAEGVENNTYKADNLNSVITDAGGTGLKADTYWTSTEEIASCAWSMHFWWGWGTWFSKTTDRYVRSIIAF